MDANAEAVQEERRMISVKQVITVSYDDPMLNQCRKQLTEQNGWEITEEIMGITFVRLQFIKSKNCRD